ncbi:MAG TPA: hypothetical protein VMN39_07740 [Longimicrobiaceae bacterium]|nr:hypothetical protein [Longimicrobiaceae bacterium]
MERKRTGGVQAEQEAASTEGASPEKERAPRKQIYLRTVYPLNPGIPHFIDVPGGW